MATVCATILRSLGALMERRAILNRERLKKMGHVTIALAPMKNCSGVLTRKRATTMSRPIAMTHHVCFWMNVGFAEGQVRWGAPTPWP